MREKQHLRLHAEREKFEARIEVRRSVERKVDRAERRVGRPFQCYGRPARFFEVKLGERDDPTQKSGKRLAIRVEQHDEHRGWAELTDRCYLLRTNLQGQDSRTLWKTYIGPTQIEDCFRNGKHDLGLRTRKRVEEAAHGTGREPFTQHRAALGGRQCDATARRQPPRTASGHTLGLPLPNKPKSN